MKTKLTFFISLLIIGSFTLYGKPNSRTRKPAVSHNKSLSLHNEGSNETPDVNNSEEDKSKLVENLNKYIKGKYKKQLFDSYLFVSIKQQRMYHIVDNNIVRTYVISGSKNGAGNNNGSNKTPLGLHSIVEKFGYKAPKAGLMVERNFTGKVSKIHKEKFCVGSDDVTSRVLWLKGEEPGLNMGGNIDSYKRFIYIHGTPEEGLLGVPSSEGCIRMKNNEVIDLFSFAYVGMKVLILDEF